MLASRQFARGVCYMVRAYACCVHKLFGLTRARHVPHGEVLEVERVGLLGERGQDGLAEAAFWPVVLDRDDVAPCCPCGGAQRLAVYWLYRVSIYDAHGQTAIMQLLCSLYGFVDCYARCDHAHHVFVRGSQDLAPADREVFRGVVDHGRLRAQRPQEDDTIRIGHLDNEPGGLVGVAGLEHGRAVHGPHHRQVLGAICDGPSSPMETPACEPERRMLAPEIAAILMKSYARVKKAAKLEAKGTLWRTLIPTAAATICCSAMNISK